MSKERELSQEEIIDFFNKIYGQHTDNVGYPQNRNKESNIRTIVPTTVVNISVNKKKK